MAPVEAACPVGTCRHTEAAADAARVVDQDDAIFALEGSIDGADLRAGWVVAMEARLREEIGRSLFRLLHSQHFDPLPPLRHKVHLGAGDGAGCASIALGQIDHHHPASALDADAGVGISGHRRGAPAVGVKHLMIGGENGTGRRYRLLHGVC